jgi:uncharacterized Zn-binding protein involved in type VI secretion
MPAVARVGDLISTGHGCDASAPIAGPGASTVFVNAFPAAINGSPIGPHTITNPASPPTPPCIPHPGQVVNTASKTVYANAVGIARNLDSADAGAITQGSPNVFAN